MSTRSKGKLQQLKLQEKPSESASYQSSSSDDGAPDDDIDLPGLDGLPVLDLIPNGPMALSTWSLLDVLDLPEDSLGAAPTSSAGRSRTLSSLTRHGSSETSDDADLPGLSAPDKEEVEEDRRLKRMRRNRESAATSRSRKKAYVEGLETKVKSLSSLVQSLQAENAELKKKYELHASLR